MMRDDRSAQPSEARRKVSVFITTYNREPLLRALVGQLGQEADDAGVGLTINVLNSGEPIGVSSFGKKLGRKLVITNDYARGRLEYWKMVEAALNQMEELPKNVVPLFLQDDVVLCKRFFSLLFRTLSTLPSDGAVFLYRDAYRRGTNAVQWTQIRSAPFSEWAERIGWIDLVAFAARPEFLSALFERNVTLQSDSSGERVVLLWRANASDSSSGVPATLSRMAEIANLPLYRTLVSLVKHVGDVSVMHERLTESQKLIAQTVDFADDVIVMEAIDEPRHVLMRKLDAGGLYYCNVMDAGQAAFSEGLEAIGFIGVTIEEAHDVLSRGGRVLVHAWRVLFRGLLDHPSGSVVVLWHSGWTGSDLMDEGQMLAEVMALVRERRVQLLWLEERDALPPGARWLPPIWDLERLRRSFDRANGLYKNGEQPHVVVGMTGRRSAKAKNVLATVAACSQVPGVFLHLSETVLHGPTGFVVRELLKDVDHEIHSALSREEVRELLARSDLVVQTSLADTWSFLALEAVFGGTPVLVSSAVRWGSDLTDDVRRHALFSGLVGTVRLRNRIQRLLACPSLLGLILAEEERVLAALSSVYRRRAIEELRLAGFRIQPE